MVHRACKPMSLLIEVNPIHVPSDDRKPRQQLNIYNGIMLWKAKAIQRLVFIEHYMSLINLFL